MVKDHTESSGWWDLHILRGTFSKGHLVSQHPEIAHRPGAAQSKLLLIVQGNKIPAVNIKNMLWKESELILFSGKSKLIPGIAFPQEPGCRTWWVL